MKLHIISFGQKGYYYDIAVDLLNRISKKYPAANIRCFSELDLNQQMISYAKRYKRGYGYWQWKPYIINSHLENLLDGDVLLYIDGRSHFKAQTIDWLNEFILSEFDLAFNCGFKESSFTTGAIFDHFAIDEMSEIRSSHQIFSGLVLLRNSYKTRKLISEWHHNLLFHSHLFRDDNMESRNSTDFIENRHDQSAYSILVKKNSYLKIQDISSKLSNKNSIIFHYKLHNRWYSKLAFLYRSNVPEYVWIYTIKLYMIFKSYSKKNVDDYTFFK